MTPQKLQLAQEMLASGRYAVAAIATTLGVSRASVYRHLTRSRADQVTAAEAVASAV